MPNEKSIRPERSTRRGRRDRAVAWGAGLLAALVVFATPQRADAIITFTPSGFVEDVVASNLPFATGIAFAPDGRMFITLKGGVVRVYQNGTLLPTPFLDITSQVSNSNDRGLLGVAVHPDFPHTPYVYLLFTWNPPGFSNIAVGARVSRLIRVEADPAQGYNVALPGSDQTADGAGRPGSRDPARDEQHCRQHRQPERRPRHHQGVVHDRPHDGRRADRELHGVRRGLALHRHGHVRQRRLAVRRQRRRLQLHGGRSARVALAEREQPLRQDHADRSADRQRPARQPLLRLHLPDV